MSSHMGQYDRNFIYIKNVIRLEYQVNQGKHDESNLILSKQGR